MWVDARGEVIRYNLAYINHHVFGGDNGRVLGYDNRHGYHHRHYQGNVEPFEFVSYEETEKRFENDWMDLLGKIIPGRQ